MGNFKKVLFLMSFLGVFSTANASFLIEPHLGYNVSGGVTSYNNAKYDYSGLQYGARLGMQYLGLMGGFAYNHSSFTLDKTQVGSSKVSAAQSQNDIGLFLGYNAPILVRAWVGYYFSTKMEQTEAGGFNANGNWYKGSTTELGVGFTPFPLISVNLMYRMVSFDTYYNGTESTLSPTYDPKEIVIGVSLPFTLL